MPWSWDWVQQYRLGKDIIEGYLEEKFPPYKPEQFHLNVRLGSGLKLILLKNTSAMQMNGDSGFHGL